MTGDRGAVVAASPTKIQIKATRPPSLVAYRDAGDPVWHAAVQRSPTRFVANVHGSYWVASVCESDTDFGGGFIVHDVFVSLQARTLQDGAELDTGCDKPGPTRHVKGRMAQGGRVSIGGNFSGSSDSDWSFQIPVAPGVYTLYASTHDRVVIRRGVDATRNVTLAPINTNTEGAELSPFAFTLTNGDPEAAVSVAVRIEQQSATFPGTMYYGAPEGARVIPTNVLTPDDNQTVSVLTDKYTYEDGVSRDYSLAQRHPFRIGDDATWTMPAQIEGVAWNTDGVNPEVHWSSLPPFTRFSADILGGRRGTSDSITYIAELSPAFLATGVTGVAFDVDTLPGFRREWQIDYSFGYNRDVFGQYFSNPLEPEHGVINSSEILDFVDTLAPSEIGAAARRRTPDRESLSGARRTLK